MRSMGSFAALAAIGGLVGYFILRIEPLDRRAFRQWLSEQGEQLSRSERATLEKAWMAACGWRNRQHKADSILAAESRYSVPQGMRKVAELLQQAQPDWSRVAVGLAAVSLVRQYDPTAWYNWTLAQKAEEKARKEREALPAPDPSWRRKKEPSPQPEAPDEAPQS